MKNCVEKIRKQETAQEILQLTRRASTEERSVQRYMNTAGCEQQHSQMENPQAENPVTIARRSHLFPSRTQQLSSLAPMILGGKLPGKVGRCRFFLAQNIFTIQRKDSSHAVFFHFGNVATFRKYGFLRSSMRHCRKEGNHETCRTAPARYMDVAGFFLP